jgi:glycosyltransferase involved in cell wall biosynthesis
MLAARQSLTGPTFKIFWSEGHMNAVRHADGPIAFVRRRALRAYQAFAVPNEAAADFIRAEVGGHASIVQLPNTVDDEFFSQARVLPKSEMRCHLGVRPGSLVILCVAQLEEYKGILELITAYAQLPQEIRADCTLILAGEGSLRRAIEMQMRSLTEGDVRIMGHLDRVRLREWLTAADAFILPTKRDPNPLSVIEAAFAGLPLIVSRKAGNVSELVVDGTNGLVIDSPTPDAIGRAIARFWQLDSDRRHSMGDHSSRLASDNFRREAVARRFAFDLIGLGSERI